MTICAAVVVLDSVVIVGLPRRVRSLGGGIAPEGGRYRTPASARAFLAPATLGPSLEPSPSP
jgi:hypothetical protein